MYYIIDQKDRMLQKHSDKIEAERWLARLLYLGYDAYITNETPEKTHPGYEEFLK